MGFGKESDVLHPNMFDENLPSFYFQVKLKHIKDHETL